MLCAHVIRITHRTLQARPGEIIEIFIRNPFTAHACMHACMLTHFLFDAFRTQRVQVLKRIVAVARGLSEKTKGSDDKAGSVHDFLSWLIF